MAQYVRPTSDISTTGWNCSTGSNFYALIDEATPNDADYVYALTASTGTLEVKGNSISTPGSGTAIMVVRWCDGYTSGISTAWASDCEISLVDNTTVLHTFQDTPPHQATYADQTFDVTAYVPSAYNNLRIRLKKGIGGDGMYVSQAYLQYPDATSSGTFVLTDVGLGTLGQRQFDYPTDNIGGPVRREDMFLTYSDADYTLLPRYCKPVDGRDAQAGFICALSGLWSPGHKLAYDDLGRPVICDYLHPANNPMPRFSRQ